LIGNPNKPMRVLHRFYFCTGALQIGLGWPN
jgi:hypothetical protein